MKKRLFSMMLAVLMMALMCVPAMAANDIQADVSVIGENVYLVNVSSNLSKADSRALVSAVAASLSGLKENNATAGAVTRAECQHKFQTVGTPLVLHINYPGQRCEVWELRTFRCQYCGMETQREMFLYSHDCH